MTSTERIPQKGMGVRKEVGKSRNGEETVEKPHGQQSPTCWVRCLHISITVSHEYRHATHLSPLFRMRCVMSPSYFHVPTRQNFPRKGPVSLSVGPRELMWDLVVDLRGTRDSRLLDCGCPSRRSQDSRERPLGRAEQLIRISGGTGRLRLRRG